MAKSKSHCRTIGKLHAKKCKKDKDPDMDRAFGRINQHKRDHAKGKSEGASYTKELWEGNSSGETQTTLMSWHKKTSAMNLDMKTWDEHVASDILRMMPVSDVASLTGITTHSIKRKKSKQRQGEQIVMSETAEVCYYNEGGTKRRPNKRSTRGQKRGNLMETAEVEEEDMFVRP